ncbi:MAG: protein kinase domain-containing protein [Stenotrophomonas sp.]|uniref:protein kinase domain-containing protein n=1 Tax=Stenotrophomonas sp. TaxID=69392 RepID=UPI003D6D0D3F
MGIERWRQVRDLFDVVCELPREQWKAALLERCDDASIRDEVEQLLRSQTVGLSRVSNRLDTALAHALMPEFGVGERLGPWRLTERIAQGGMGTVFKAERADGVYQRTVAIKLLHGLPGAIEVERLEAERQVLANLQLPQVARLYDGGTTPDGHPYLVMEFVDGVPLDRWCVEHQLGLVQRLQLFLDICSIVQSAHEQLVLHCDLKPNNVLVMNNGQPVLLDFGLARLLNEARDSQNSGFCTPAYASPEMIAGDAVGAASDVYSLGVMLVELLSQQPCAREPQDTEVPVVLPSANAAEALPWRNKLRGDLDAIARKACAIKVGERYRTVEALIADVRRYLERQPVVARGGGRWYRLRKGLRRNWHGVALVTGVVTVSSIFITGLLQSRHQAQEDAAVARQVSNFMIGVFETADPFLRTERGEEELTSRQLLDKAALQVSHDLADAPAQLARMRAVLGVAYQNSGVSHQAEALLQQAYNGFMDPRVHRKEDAAAVLADLSVQKTLDGNGRLGLQMANQGLALLRSDDASATRAKLLGAKGMALINQQAFDQAEVVLDAATTLYDKQADPTAAAKRLELTYNKGLMYLRWGRQEAAEREFGEVLASLHGRRTSMALASEVRLAQVLREQGKYAQALPLLQSGMRHALELYGPRSRFVLIQHDGLADLYSDSGDYAAADKQYEQRHALSALLDGIDSVEYSMGLFNHGTLRELRGDLSAAERLYRQALEIRTDRLGIDSPTSLRAESGLGRLLMRDGRMEEAGRLLMHADQGLAAALPVDAPGRIEARLNRIDWLVRMGQTQQAGQLLEEMATHVPASFHLQMLQVRSALAWRLGQGGQALALRRAALEFARGRFGEAGSETASSRLALAETLLLLSHAQPALDELRKAEPVLQKLQVPTSPERRQLDGLVLLARTSLEGGQAH